MGIVFVPLGPQILWYGSDENPTRTDTANGETQWGSVHIMYQGTTLLPPFEAGVRISFLGYKDRSAAEWFVDADRWNNVLDLARSGVVVTGSVVDQVDGGTDIQTTDVSHDMM